MPELYYAVHNNKFYNGARPSGYQWSENQLFALTCEQIRYLITEPSFPKDNVNFYKLTTDDMFFP